MTDQERITDLIFSEKKMGDNYSIWASECTNRKLRDTFLTLLDQSHKTQTDLFTTAQQKGWRKRETPCPWHGVSFCPGVGNKKLAFSLWMW